MDYTTLILNSVSHKTADNGRSLWGKSGRGRGLADGTPSLLWVWLTDQWDLKTDKYQAENHQLCQVQKRFASSAPGTGKKTFACIFRKACFVCSCQGCKSFLGHKSKQVLESLNLFTRFVHHIFSFFVHTFC